MLHITFSKYDCIIVHKAYYLFTCTCVSINSFHSYSHSHMRIIMYSYRTQTIYVKWGNICSAYFRVSNNNTVRQGGIVALQLFSVYVDKLSTVLPAAKTDDLCVVAASIWLTK